MKATEINDIVAKIRRGQWELNEKLEENGGELTDELLEQFDFVEELKALLQGEGVDDLGRLLKNVQDDIAMRKAEADAAARRVKNLKRYEDFLKFTIGQVIDTLDAPVNDKGEKVLNGQFYGFKRGTSTKGSVNAETLDAAYLDAAKEAARNAGLPAFVDVALVTNVTRLREYGTANGEDTVADFITEDTAPSLTFNKPRAAKEA